MQFETFLGSWESQQDRVTAKLGEEYEPSIIVKAAEQYFSCTGCNNMVFVLKKMQKRARKIGLKTTKDFCEPH